MPHSHRQSGFSLLELLVAMMIIAVIATLGVRQFQRHSAKARHLKAADTLRTVSESLDTYYLNHGTYPDIASFDAMVEPNSVLVKENLLAVNMPPKDPWGQPYEGKSAKAGGTYSLKCLGDPGSQDEELGPIVREPGKVSGISGTPAAGAAPGGAAPAPEGAKP